MAIMVWETGNKSESCLIEPLHPSALSQLE
jgi:hypothetical protein